MVGLQVPVKMLPGLQTSRQGEINRPTLHTRLHASLGQPGEEGLLRKHHQGHATIYRPQIIAAGGSLADHGGTGGATYQARISTCHSVPVGEHAPAGNWIPP